VHGIPISADDGPQMDSLVIFGSLYNLGGLQPCGCSHLATYSGSKDLLIRKVVFHSVDYVGSMASSLYSGSSNRAKIFSM
jgi:hypothetical protein